jgi:phospholipid transport system substrate-binding protein
VLQAIPPLQTVARGKIMLKPIVRSVALFTLFVAAIASAQEAPDALVRKSVDEVLAVIKETKDQRKLVEVAEAKVLPYFDFTRMTRLAVGRNWSQASAAQQKALENGFRTLLVRTYTTALSRTSGEARVEVKPFASKPGDDETVVKTVATEPGRQAIQIDYRMAKAPGGWKVYDVVVENLSLVTNYRGSFQSEIDRSGIDGLIKVIEAKNQKSREG